jgi:Ca2+-binding EF-hand superfamily protein
LNKLAKVSGRNWKSRYFWLTPLALLYFVEEKSSKAGISAKQGEIQITGDSSVEEEEKVEGQGFSFRVTTPWESMKLAAATVADRSSWIKAINAAIESNRQGFRGYQLKSGTVMSSKKFFILRPDLFTCHPDHSQPSKIENMVNLNGKTKITGVNDAKFLFTVEDGDQKDSKYKFTIQFDKSNESDYRQWLSFLRARVTGSGISAETVPEVESSVKTEKNEPPMMKASSLTIDVTKETPTGTPRSSFTSERTSEVSNRSDDTVTVTNSSATRAIQSLSNIRAELQLNEQSAARSRTSSEVEGIASAGVPLAAMRQELFSTSTTRSQSLPAAETSSLPAADHIVRAQSTLPPPPPPPPPGPPPRPSMQTGPSPPKPPPPATPAPPKQSPVMNDSSPPLPAFSHTAHLSGHDKEMKAHSRRSPDVSQMDAGAPTTPGRKRTAAPVFGDDDDEDTENEERQDVQRERKSSVDSGELLSKRVIDGELAQGYSSPVSSPQSTMFSEVVDTGGWTLGKLYTDNRSKKKPLVRMVFDMYSNQETKSVGVTELQTLCYDLGTYVPAPLAQATVRKYDSKRCGELDYDDFMVWWRMNDRFNTLKFSDVAIQQKNVAASTFRQMDLSLCGYLTRQDFRLVYKRVLSALNMKLADVAEVLNLIDEEDSGKVYFANFIEWFADAISAKNSGGTLSKLLKQVSGKTTRGSPTSSRKQFGASLESQRFMSENDKYMGDGDDNDELDGADLTEESFVPAKRPSLLYMDEPPVPLTLPIDRKEEIYEDAETTTMPVSSRSSVDSETPRERVTSSRLKKIQFAQAAEAQQSRASQKPSAATSNSRPEKKAPQAGENLSKPFSPDNKEIALPVEMPAKKSLNAFERVRARKASKQQETMALPDLNKLGPDWQEQAPPNPVLVHDGTDLDPMVLAKYEKLSKELEDIDVTGFDNDIHNSSSTAASIFGLDFDFEDSNREVTPSYFFSGGVIDSSDDENEPSVNTKQPAPVTSAATKLAADAPAAKKVSQPPVPKSSVAEQLNMARTNVGTTIAATAPVLIPEPVESEPVSSRDKEPPSPSKAKYARISAAFTAESSRKTTTLLTKLRDARKSQANITPSVTAQSAANPSTMNPGAGAFQAVSKGGNDFVNPLAKKAPSSQTTTSADNSAPKPPPPQPPSQPAASKPPAPAAPAARPAAPSVVTANNPKFEKFEKMKKLLPEFVVRQKMKQDGLSEEEINAFYAEGAGTSSPAAPAGPTSPKPPPPPPPGPPSGPKPAPPTMKAPPAPTPATPGIDYSVDPRYEKFIKMRKLLPEPVVRHKMKSEGFSEPEIDKFMNTNTDSMDTSSAKPAAPAPPASASSASAAPPPPAQPKPAAPPAPAPPAVLRSSSEDGTATSGTVSKLQAKLTGNSAPSQSFAPLTMSRDELAKLAADQTAVVPRLQTQPAAAVLKYEESKTKAAISTEKKSEPSGGAMTSASATAEAPVDHAYNALFSTIRKKPVSTFSPVDNSYGNTTRLSEFVGQIEQQLDQSNKLLSNENLWHPSMTDDGAPPAVIESSQHVEQSTKAGRDNIYEKFSAYQQLLSKRNEIEQALQQLIQQERGALKRIQEDEERSLRRIQDVEAESIRRIEERERIFNETVASAREELRADQDKYESDVNKLRQAEQRSDRLHKQRLAEVNLVATALSHHHKHIQEERKTIARQRFQLEAALVNLNMPAPVVVQQPPVLVPQYIQQQLPVKPNMEVTAIRGNRYATSSSRYAGYDNFGGHQQQAQFPSSDASVGLASHGDDASVYSMPYSSLPAYAVPKSKMRSVSPLSSSSGNYNRPRNRGEEHYNPNSTRFAAAQRKNSPARAPYVVSTKNLSTRL